MKLKRSAIMWSVILILVLLMTGGLYVLTHRNKVAAVNPIQATYTLDDVHAASTTEKCYAAISDSVYDFTPYVQGNPAFTSLCGTDATEAVKQLGPDAGATFANLRIGSLKR